MAALPLFVGLWATSLSLPTAGSPSSWKDKITISEETNGVFQETIPQTGTVEPSRTVFLDAIEGGNIKA